MTQYVLRATPPSSHHGKSGAYREPYARYRSLYPALAATFHATG